jgi:hypothetical protein
LKIYIVLIFKTRKINQETFKKTKISMLIKTKKKTECYIFVEKIANLKAKEPI